MDKFLELLRYLLLGAVQGFSEILPISSSAHLIIIQNLLGIEQQSLFFEMLLHLGSALAVIFYFRKRLIQMIHGTWRYFIKKDISKSKEVDLFLALFIASVPAAIVGFIFKDIVASVFTSLIFVSAGLMITSFLLVHIRCKNDESSLITYKNALIIGLYQAIGIIPGISRSAITLYGAKGQKIDDTTAGDFVFLMFIPVALGSGILSLINLFSQKVTNLMPTIIAFLVALITTYISLKLFLRLIKKRKIRKIAYYTFTLSILVLIYYFTS